MGPAQSARRIQPGEMRSAGAGSADPRLRLPSVPRANPSAGAGRGGRAGAGTAARPAAGPGRAHFLRGGAPRPAPGRLGRPPAGRWPGAARAAAGVKAPGQQVSPNPGAEGEDRRRALLPPRRRRRGGGRRPLRGAASSQRGVSRGGAEAGPAGPRRRCQPGRTVLSAPRPRGAAGPGSRAALGRPGSAAMSATHPTRLETRTKESSTCASQGPLSKARGAMKVRAGARRLRWDPGARVAPGSPGRTTGPSRPPPPRGAGEVERERPC